MKKLDPGQMALLATILKKRSAKHLLLVKEKGLPELTANELNELRDILADEFSEVGVAGDSEPNELGLEIESLIDALAPY